jgi:hypothetical protein
LQFISNLRFIILFSVICIVAVLAASTIALSSISFACRIRSNFLVIYILLYFIFCFI